MFELDCLLNKFLNLVQTQLIKKTNIYKLFTFLSSRAQTDSYHPPPPQKKKKVEEEKSLTVIGLQWPCPSWFVYRPHCHGSCHTKLLQFLVQLLVLILRYRRLVSPKSWIDTNVIVKNLMQATCNLNVVPFCEKLKSISFYI